MREKYVEESYPRWFVFGEYKDGYVDVSDPVQDIAVHVSRHDAERMIAERNKAINALCLLALAFSEAAPKQFAQIWYDGKDALCHGGTARASPPRSAS